jgi:hypothetical protein
MADTSSRFSVECKSIFKDSGSIRKPLSRLWAEVINCLENLCESSYKSSCEISYIEAQQRHSHQSLANDWVSGE